MILRHLSKLAKTPTSKFNQGIFRSSLPCYQMSQVSEWVRKFMNRIRFEDNRAIEARQDKISIQVHQTTKQVEEKFVGDEKFKSLVEKERMQKIDEILGTKTYFHETKVYQERLDSDHVQQITDLKKKHGDTKRMYLDFENPQAPMQYKVKSTRKFFKNLKNLRQYPKHNYRIKDFGDEKAQQNIEFMGKESLYSKLSLKWVDTYQKSLENETIDEISYQLQSFRMSKNYVYFSVLYEPTKLFRIPKQHFSEKLSTSLDKFTELQKKIQEVISLEEIYDQLKQYYHDERVSQWLKKVENGQIQYLLSGYRTNQKEDEVLVWVDLLGTKKEYVHLFKRIGMKDQKRNDKVSPKGESKKPDNQHFSSQVPSTHHQTNLTAFHSNLIFNCKPSAIFSSSSLYLIQRSEEGGFIELINVKINENSHSLSNEREVVFKCKPYEELDLLTDESQRFALLKVRNLSSGTQKEYGINEKQDGEYDELLEIKLNEEGKSVPTKIIVSASPQGLIVANFYSTHDEYLKYGSNREFCSKVWLIPFKSHIQLMQQSSSINPHQLPPSSKSTSVSPSFSDLDLSASPSLIFSCSEEEFISEISCRTSHLIVSLSTLSIYSKKRLYFLPYDKSKNPHSLIFSALQLKLLKFGYNYDSQVVDFCAKRTQLLNEYYAYTVWKKQLKQRKNDDLYIEKVRIDENIQINVICESKYLQHLPKFAKQESTQLGQEISDEKQQLYKLQNSKVPILVYLTDLKPQQSQLSSSSKPQLHLRRFLKKGTLVITVSCRGTFTSDLITFYKGSRLEFHNMLNDMTNAVSWIGNNLGSNISFYGKGPISGLVGMLLNTRFPELFTSTVISDGVYELLKGNQSQAVEYFIEKREDNENKWEKYWKWYNVGTLGYKRSSLATKDQMSQEPIKNEQEQNTTDNTQSDNTQNQDLTQQKQQQSKQTSKQLAKREPLEFGLLQNILITCSPTSVSSKFQSRLLTYHLRRNPYQRYQQVYLKQFFETEDQQLFNLSYIYGKMKERLELENKN